MFDILDIAGIITLTRRLYRNILNVRDKLYYYV